MKNVKSAHLKDTNRQEKLSRNFYCAIWYDDFIVITLTLTLTTGRYHSSVTE